MSDERQAMRREEPIGKCVEESQSTRKKGKRTGAKKRGERNCELGRQGEEAAARFLVKQGYDILARNWTCFAGEADIVATDGISLVFVEVKTRSGIERGMPSEAVDEAKRNRYERIALAFLSEHDVGEMPVRFDVMAIVPTVPGRALMRHHINAFAAG